ncbi:MAG TPA: hypothetical protein VF098_11075 [Sphingomicrobium sp.]
MHRVHDWVGRKDREAVEIDAVVHRLDGTQSPVKLTNVTEEGCRIESSSDLRIGEELAIAIPRMGQMVAQIRWALPGSAGARFLSEGSL